jgi:hypothetical protein
VAVLIASSAIFMASVLAVGAWFPRNPQITVRVILP